MKSVWGFLVFALVGLGVVSCQQGGNTQALESRIQKLETQVQSLQQEVQSLKAQLASLQAGPEKTPKKTTAKESKGVKPRPPKKKGG